MSLQRLGVLGCCSLPLVGAVFYGPSVQDKPAEKKPLLKYESAAAPIVRKYCAPCHTGARPPGGIDLVRFKTSGDVQKALDVWGRVLANVEAKTMPPQGNRQPAAAERNALATWIRAAQSDADCDLNEPGRVTIRRLNRVEYDNTIRDLVEIDFKAAEDFPSDDVGHGFDNIGDVLTLSPLLLEKYLKAAERIAELAIALQYKADVRFEGSNLLDDGHGVLVLEDGSHMMTTASELYLNHRFSTGGNYIIRAKAWASRGGPELAKMAFRVNGADQSVVEVAANRGKPQVYEVPVTIVTGTHRIAVAFTNDYYEPNAKDPALRDRNLIVDYVEIIGPLGATTTLPPSHLKLIPIQPTSGNRSAVARTTLTRLAERAYRRPPTTLEIERLMKVYALAANTKEPFERGIRLGLQAVLASPHFLFRVELDPKVGPKKATRALSDWELASRLSYFLWSTMPDEALFAKARAGMLQRDEVLKDEVMRMLKNPKARALSDNFAAQWLQLRKLAIVSPDAKQFPQFDDDLRQAMAEETRRFFDAVVREDQSVMRFLDGKFTYVNGPLAKLYGFPGISGSDFQRIELDKPERAGVLTHASVLTVTSNPTRTSPVKRGKWVLDNILGTPTPPPPPGADNLAESQPFVEKLTLRKRMETHRKKPECATCHARLDPLGFGLENFDPIGAWREKEGDLSIDASGVLPDGSRFTGPAQLRSILVTRKNDFLRCFGEKLATYALGRGLGPSDRCIVDEIAKKAPKSDNRFSSIVLAIVMSKPFRERRIDAGGKP